MLYTNYVSQIAALLDITATVVNPASSAPFSVADYNIGISASVAWAENRMRRDLDFLATVTIDEGGASSANSRVFTYPTSNAATFVVVEQLYLFVSSVRQPPMYPVSLEFLNAAYPSDTALSPAPSYPQYWAPLNESSAIIGPAPDINYRIGVVGTKAPIPLSSTNASNWLSLYVPDLYIAAAMTFWSALERNYGALSGDPQMSATWEGEYERILKGAMTEEARKKFQSAGWGARLQYPVSTPPQT